ncbi:MAG TPA: hypothetical protein VMX75_13430, partial [Spirochaetia bacterium]|nr:hypothetical protein [Spirochaetia bacterium]
NGLSSQNWDLIAANIPAKAGVPVLESLIESFSRRHTERGAVAIVTVANLAQMVRQMIGTTGSEVVYSESTRSHTVFHFRRVSGKKAVGEQTFSLRPYIRRNAAFQGPHGEYSLKTVYDLPEFDTLGFRSRIAMELLEGLSRKGPFVIWNPGQGHLPVFLCRGRVAKGMDAMGRDAPGNGYVLAGRDLLALEVSRLNLLENGVRENNVRVLHTPFLDDLEEAAELLIYFPDENSSVQWYATLLDSCSRLIERTGQLLVVSRSVHAFRLLQAMSSFTIMRDRKFHGFRGLVLEKA